MNQTGITPESHNGRGTNGTSQGRKAPGESARVDHPRVTEEGHGLIEIPASIASANGQERDQIGASVASGNGQERDQIAVTVASGNGQGRDQITVPAASGNGQEGAQIHVSAAPANGQERAQIPASAAAGNGHGHAQGTPATAHLIAPHGGSLIKLWTSPADSEVLALQAQRFPRIALNSRQQADLELLANGAYSPLRGFLGRDDLDSVLERSRLASGTVWTIPIILAVDSHAAARLSPGDRVALDDEAGELLGVLDLEEKYTWNKDAYAQSVFGTSDLAHPGVKRMYEKGDWLLGGSIAVVRRPETIEFPEYHLDPVQTRAYIASKGWRTVVGFQTRNPIHRAHEFMLKSALEIFDALMIQPLVGETRPSDIPARVRLRCYEALIEGYYPKDRTLLAVLPAVMRFAGPREAVFHALIRKNYGCTHFIVGRDHAGVGNYYGTYDAQRIFDQFAPEEIGILPLRFEHTFYCNVCQGMASFKTCPHPTDQHLTLSGTRVREMLAQREAPPVEFTRPEVARILMEMSSPSSPSSTAEVTHDAQSTIAP